MNKGINNSLDTQSMVADEMSKVAQSLGSLNEVSFTKDEIEKIAEYISKSGKAIKCAVSIAKDILKDAEDMSSKIDKIEKEAHEKEREDKIDKIASMLNSNGLISKSAMVEKRKELEGMTDEFLNNFENTLSGISGTVEKSASEDGLISTFAFMDKSVYDVSETEEKKGFPTPLHF